MNWFLTKVVGVALAVLPLAIIGFIITFEYGTLIFLEVIGLLSLGIVFMLVSILCVWIGTMILKI